MDFGESGLQVRMDIMRTYPSAGHDADAARSLFFQSNQLIKGQSAE
jgi:hypothetical protein